MVFQCLRHDYLEKAKHEKKKKKQYGCPSRFRLEPPTRQASPGSASSDSMKQKGNSSAKMRNATCARKPTKSTPFPRRRRSPSRPRSEAGRIFGAGDLLCRCGTRRTRHQRSSNVLERGFTSSARLQECRREWRSKLHNAIKKTGRRNSAAHRTDTTSRFETLHALNVS